MCKHYAGALAGKGDFTYAARVDLHRVDAALVDEVRKQDLVFCVQGEQIYKLVRLAYEAGQNIVRGLLRAADCGYVVVFRGFVAREQGG